MRVLYSCKRMLFAVNRRGQVYAACYDDDDVYGLASEFRQKHRTAKVMVADRDSELYDELFTKFSEEGFRL